MDKTANVIEHKSRPVTRKPRDADPKPTSDHPADLLRTQRQQHVRKRATAVSFNISFLQNPC